MTVGIAGEHITGERLAFGLSQVYGEPVRYQSLPLEIFRSLPFPGIDVAANMIQYVAEANTEYCRPRDVRLARLLNPSLLGSQLLYVRVSRRWWRNSASPTTSTIIRSPRRNWRSDARSTRTG